LVVPAEIAVTVPALVMVATDVLLLVHVPDVLGVTFVVKPIHTEVAPPITGFVGTGLMTTFAEAGEVHELLFVTVNVYVALAGRPVTVNEVPEPEYVVPPGVRVMVHEPEDGKPFKKTLPVVKIQVGWVIEPITDAVGLA
jgi:hypothetical protein